MGEVVGAALVAHVPTIMLPEEVRLEINEGREITLVPGLHRIKSECLDRLGPDAVIVFDTHWESTFEHIVTAHDRRQGKFTSHELPRGMKQIPYDMPGDPELANAIAAQAEGRDDCWILANETEYGLATILYTGEPERARCVSERLVAGTVWVNCFFVRDLRAPFGGARSSGVGREGGVYSFDFYSDVKNVCSAPWAS